MSVKVSWIHSYFKGLENVPDYGEEGLGATRWISMDQHVCSGLGGPRRQSNGRIGGVDEGVGSAVTALLGVTGRGTVGHIPQKSRRSPSWGHQASKVPARDR